MKQIVVTILVLFATAAVLIGSLTASIKAHKEPHHEAAEVSHSAGSH